MPEGLDILRPRNIRLQVRRALQDGARLGVRPILACATLATLLVSSVAHGQIYRWLDEEGRAHYTILRGTRPTTPAPADTDAQPMQRIAPPARAPEPDTSGSGARAERIPSEPEGTALAPSRPPAEPAPTRVQPATTPSEPRISSVPAVEARPAAEAMPAVPSSVLPPATAFDPLSSTRAPESRANDPRIAGLEAEIARDRARLKDLISSERTTGAQLVSDPQLLEIAERLPRLQAQLRALQGELP